MLCRHEVLDQPPEPREMARLKPHRWFCKVCGLVWDCRIEGRHPEEEPPPAVSEGLKAELERIIREKLERRDD